ncbi:MAG TPA: GNAT family N-acetyltransferase [Candidatus Limnocylindrales bacterium]|nr:GNAT family N-acetyltransferase [Candidatus Limnocylindrales bacterium]
MTTTRAPSMDAGAVGAQPDGVTLRLSVDLDAEVPKLWAVADAVRRDAGEIDLSTVDGMRAYYRNLENCDPATDLVIARRGDEVVGYARVLWSDTTDGERWYECACFVHPSERRRGLGRRLLEWTERRRVEVAAAEAATLNGRPAWLTTYIHDGDVGGDVLLRSAGYEPIRRFFSMRRPDLDELAVVPLPGGLEIRPIAFEPDAMKAVIAADHEAFQDHFGSVEDVETFYGQVMEDPDSDVSLWVVAFDGDEVAGAVLNGVRSSEPTVGWLDSIFTRRPWRQRGLARALIAHSLRLLRERGMTQAALGVDASNPNQALRLYESCGFEVASSSTAYRKPLPADGVSPAVRVQEPRG